MINQEDIYTLIQQEKWGSILDALYKNRKDIKSDSMLKLSADTFVNEFIRKIPEYPTDRKDITGNMTTLWQLHYGNFYKLPEDRFKVLVVEIVKRYSHDIKQQYNYAKDFPDDPVCATAIEEYEKTQAKAVNHSQHHNIQVVEQPFEAETDHTIPLFKSRQEAEFFMALRNVFASFQVSTNVAISNIFNDKTLLPKLNRKETDFYFKGIVDFVIYDQAKAYKPVHFIELDSSFHDLEKQQARDKLKDSIFYKAGVKLLRVRKLDKTVDETGFTLMIRELLGN